DLAPRRGPRGERAVQRRGRVGERADHAGAGHDDPPLPAAPLGRAAAHGRSLRRISDALLPPNAYALFIATSTRTSRAALGTKSSAPSGSSRFMVGGMRSWWTASAQTAVSIADAAPMVW